MLSGGRIIDEPASDGRGNSSASQAALIIKPDGLVESRTFRSRVGEMIDRIKKRATGIRLPGERSFTSRTATEHRGEIDIEDSLVDELNKWAKILSIDPV